MSKLLDLFEQVRDENLNKEQLENLYSQMARLRADVKLELAGILKKKAMYLLPNPELPTTAVERKWRATTDGQREIELKSYVSACGDHLDSLKTRIFSLL